VAQPTQCPVRLATPQTQQQVTCLLVPLDAVQDVFRGYISEEASYEWSRACNYHRGVDLGHVCGNPGACSKRIAKAEALEMFQRDLAREWS
jgi:hypothetical protein